MRISPPHAGHRRRSGRKTRSRSGVLDWRLAIAPLQLDCKPNRPSLPDSKLCRRSFFVRRFPNAENVVDCLALTDLGAAANTRGLMAGALRASITDRVSSVSHEPMGGEAHHAPATIELLAGAFSLLILSDIRFMR